MRYSEEYVEQLENIANNRAEVQEKWYKAGWEDGVREERAHADRLVKYARHLNNGKEPMCERLKHDDYPCTCGLDDLIDAHNQRSAGE